MRERQRESTTQSRYSSNVHVASLQYCWLMRTNVYWMRLLEDSCTGWPASSTHQASADSELVLELVPLVSNFQSRMEASGILIELEVLSYPELM